MTMPIAAESATESQIPAKTATATPLSAHGEGPGVRSAAESATESQIPAESATESQIPAESATAHAGRTTGLHAVRRVRRPLVAAPSHPRIPAESATVSLPPPRCSSVLSVDQSSYSGTNGKQE